MGFFDSDCTLKEGRIFTPSEIKKKNPVTWRSIVKVLLESHETLILKIFYVRGYWESMYTEAFESD